MDILREHQMLTNRNGFAVCSARECGWRLDFEWEDWKVPVWVEESHAAHVLELLRGVGFSQAGNAKADVALRRIADEVSLLVTGGTYTGDCGPVWCEPIFPVPKRVQAILDEGGWDKY